MSLLSATKRSEILRVVPEKGDITFFCCIQQQVSTISVVLAASKAGTRQIGGPTQGCFDHQSRYRSLQIDWPRIDEACSGLDARHPLKPLLGCFPDCPLPFAPPLILPPVPFDDFPGSDGAPKFP